MDIRTKLALALVFFALFGMTVLGLFAYSTAAALLEDASKRQIDALADSKARDLTHVVEGWQEGVRLIGSRTQLRLSLAAHQAGQLTDLSGVQRILDDVVRASRQVEHISVYDASGRRVASAGAAYDPPARWLEGSGGLSFSPVVADGDAPKVALGGPLELDGKRIGRIEVLIDASDVATVAGDVTGLGRTGEVLVVARTASGDPRLLHERRHAVDGKGTALGASYIAAALDGQHAVFAEGVVDERGEEVWAATRFIAQLGWGLIVKVDADEELEPVSQLRRDMIDLGLALGAFAIGAGTLLGFQLGRPIRDLADLVVRLRHGESHLRAEVRGDDEVAVLADALNEWMDEMDERSEGAER